MGAQQEARPQVPQLDPSIQKLSDQQMKDAQDFQAKAGDMKQQQGNMVKQSENQALAGKKSDITKSAASRGLLYSGLKEGAQAQAQGESAGKVAQSQAGINDAVEKQSDSLNKAALSSQMGVQDLQSKRQALAYNMAKS